MTIVHFFVESFDPERGGMEESASRLVQYFESDPEIKFVGYLIRTYDKGKPPNHHARVFDLEARGRRLVEPLESGSSDIGIGRETRLQILVGKRILENVLRKYPNDRHVLLSFYIPTAGFVAQHLACELRLPHIACARGSDLGHQLFILDRMHGIEFVVKRASCVVTTNLYHGHLAREICGRQGEVHTIYNGLPENVSPCWQRRDSGRVRLVSAGGYCVKKGTHLLLEAAGRLLDEGLPIDLFIVGPTRLGNWDKLRETYSTRYSPRIWLGSRIDYNEMQSFLLGGDIYCSASLSEGCSNATMLALGLGMPIVSTATGALLDLAGGMEHVQLVAPGSARELTEALRCTVRKVLNNSLVVDRDRVGQIDQRLSRQRERSDWRDLFHHVAKETNSDAPAIPS